MEAEVGQSPGEALALKVGRRKGFRGSLQRWQHGRDVFVTPDPQDLFGKILGAGKIVAPAGRNHEHAAPVDLDDAAEPFQGLYRFRQGPRFTCHTLQKGLGKRDGCAGGGHGTSGPGPRQLRAAPVHEPSHQQVPGDPRHGRIGPPAEPMGSIRMQVVAPRGGADGLWIEPRALQQHPMRGLGHLGAVAAHDARQGDGA